jgi:hypothetical protein
MTVAVPRASIMRARKLDPLAANVSEMQKDHSAKISIPTTVLTPHGEEDIPI